MPFGHVPVSPSLPFSDLPSVISDRSGTISRRARNRATESCEYVQPLTVKPCVAVPGEAAAAAAGSGACASSVNSQTSLGVTCETSRSSRSHATR